MRIKKFVVTVEITTGMDYDPIMVANQIANTLEDDGWDFDKNIKVEEKQ